MQINGQTWATANLTAPELTVGLKEQTSCHVACYIQYYIVYCAVKLFHIIFQPVSSSAAFLLGEIVGAAKQDAAQPLVRFFMHHGQLVPLIGALAQHEISRIT